MVRETIFGVGPHPEGATMFVMMLIGLAIAGGFIWLGFKALDIAEIIERRKLDKESYDVGRRGKGGEN